MAWAIYEERDKRGILQRVQLEETFELNNPTGPTAIIRLLNFDRTEHGWKVSTTGPRGGRQENPIFSPEAIRAFIRHLRITIDD